MNLRTALELKLTTVNSVKEKKFEFKNQVFASSLTKRFVASFKGMDLLVTIEEKGNPPRPSLFFQWGQGSAFIHSYGTEAAK